MKCWSSDRFDAEERIYIGTWIIDFESGHIKKSQWVHNKRQNLDLYLDINEENFIKAVRTVK